MAVGGWSPLAVGGGWWLAVGGGWWRLVAGGRTPHPPTPEWLANGIPLTCGATRTEPSLDRVRVRRTRTSASTAADGATKRVSGRGGASSRGAAPFDDRWGRGAGVRPVLAAQGSARAGARGRRPDGVARSRGTCPAGPWRRVAYHSSSSSCAVVPSCRWRRATSDRPTTFPLLLASLTSIWADQTGVGRGMGRDGGGQARGMSEVMDPRRRSRPHSLAASHRITAHLRGTTAGALQHSAKRRASDRHQRAMRAPLCAERHAPHRRISDEAPPQRWSAAREPPGGGASGNPPDVQNGETTPAARHPWPQPCPRPKPPQAPSHTSRN